MLGVHFFQQHQDAHKRIIIALGNMCKKLCTDLKMMPNCLTVKDWGHHCVEVQLEGKKVFCVSLFDDDELYEVSCWDCCDILIPAGNFFREGRVCGEYLQTAVVNFEKTCEIFEACIRYPTGKHVTQAIKSQKQQFLTPSIPIMIEHVKPLAISWKRKGKKEQLEIFSGTDDAEMLLDGKKVLSVRVVPVGQQNRYHVLRWMPDETPVLETTDKHYRVVQILSRHVCEMRSKKASEPTD